MAGLNIQRLRDILDAVYDAGNGVLKTSGSGGGGGSSSITSNTSIEYGSGAVTAKTQRTTPASIDPIVSTQLTTTGSTAAIATNGAKLVGMTAKVASIGTNVIVRAEVSNVGGTNALDWDNAATTNTDTTITANGTKAFIFNCAFAYVRFTWVSSSGGTPTIDVVTRLA